MTDLAKAVEIVGSTLCPRCNGNIVFFTDSIGHTAPICKYAEGLRKRFGLNNSALEPGEADG